MVDSSSYLTNFGDKGFHIVEGLLDAERVAALRKHLEALGFKPSPRGSAEDPEFLYVSGAAVRGSQHLPEKWPASVLSSVLPFVGEDVDLLASTAVRKQPHGKSYLPWHQDEPYLHDPTSDVLDVMIAIDDLTSETGCLAVLPGSHKRGLLPHREGAGGPECHAADDPDQGVTIPLKSGDAVFFPSRLVHRCGVNTSGHPVNDLVLRLVPSTPAAGASTAVPLLRRGARA